MGFLAIGSLSEKDRHLRAELGELKGTGNECDE
jgi:hypothetical protein